MNDCNHPDPTKCWRGIPDLPDWEGREGCMGDCGCKGHCRTSVGMNDFFSNFTVIPSKFGGKPTISRDMFDCGNKFKSDVIYILYVELRAYSLCLLLRKQHFQFMKKY